MTYLIFAAAWLVFGLMNIGGYSMYNGEKTKIEAVLYFFLGPIVTFVWLGSVLYKKIS